MTIHLLLFIIHLVQSTCPQTCNCILRTLSCSICVNSFLQKYNATTSTCQCMEGLTHFQGGGDYCCPLTCFKCYNRGCAVCAGITQKYWNETYRFWDCICPKNYIQNGSTCSCKSLLQPTLFYYNPQDESCMKCPKNCICDSSGCNYCYQTANRTVIILQNNRRVCPCKGVLVDMDGSCQCFDNCTCQNNQLGTCLVPNRDQLTLGCEPPFIQKGTSCQCPQNFQQQFVFSKSRCVCKSFRSPGQYYQADGKCYKTSSQCAYDNRGCISCDNPLMQQNNMKCFCSFNSVEANGECVCVDPYYYNQVSQKCECLSFLRPLQYFYLPLWDICRKCPQNCTCSTKGCILCGPKSLRHVQILNPANVSQGVLKNEDLPEGNSQQYFICNCIKNAKLSGQNCICEPQYYYDSVQGVCVCKNELQPTFAYYFDFVCRLCPVGCQCNSQGCISCLNTSRRIIKQVVKDSYFICPCIFAAVQIQPGSKCTCQWQQSLPSTLICRCSPFQQIAVDAENNSYCKCLSNSLPREYYFDPLLEECKPCPWGCLCDSSGCYDCDQMSLRYTDTILFQNRIYSRCPCLQNAYYIDNECVICDSDQYYNGVNCTTCFDCLKCNKHGCLECPIGARLTDDHKCVCINQNYTLIQKQCVCNKGTYRQNRTDLSNLDFECLPCPSYCSSCKISQIHNGLECQDCNTTGTHRQAIPKNNCTCLLNYTEAPIKASYCCPIFCYDCNQTDCISCPIYTFRTLRQGRCVCEQPYLQIGQTVCGCSNQSYYFNQTCLKCPPKCQGCVQQQSGSIPKCRACIENSNRKTSSIFCPCLDGFIESIPEKPYCYAKNCKHQEALCTECEGDFLVGKKGTCICALGFYQSQNNCLPCSITGCLNCYSKSTCSWCQEENQYYLVESVCLKVTSNDFIMAQFSSMIILQIRLDQQIEVNQQKMLASISVIKQPNSTKQIPSTFLDILIVFVNHTVYGTILSTILTNSHKQFSNIIISLVSTRLDDNEVSPITSINVKTKRIISGELLEELDSLSYKSIWVTVLIFMCLALIINLNGYKHNQIMFYLQTLSFLCYYLGGARFQIVQILFNMKVSYFKFGSGPISRLVPDYYLQSSSGNFGWLTIDSNIIRLIDLPILLFCLLNLSFTVLILVLTFLKKRFSLNPQFITYKKLLYRIYQFSFKSLMYPLIFFSFNTLINIKCKVYIYSYFKYHCLGVSILFIVFHILLVVFLVCFVRMSNLYSIQLITELVIDYCASIALITSLGEKVLWLPVLILIIAIKDLSYYFIRRRFTRQNFMVSYLQLAVIPIQVIPLFMIYFDLPYQAMATILISLISQAFVQFLIIRKIRKISQFEKLRVNIELNEQATTSNWIIIPVH